MLFGLTEFFLFLFLSFFLFFVAVVGYPRYWAYVVLLPGFGFDYALARSGLRVDSVASDSHFVPDLPGHPR
jgi:hypothetical protein